MESFGDRLSRERHRLGISQQEVADRADTYKSFIASIESGRHSNLTLDVARRIAGALGFDVDFIWRKKD